MAEQILHFIWTISILTLLMIQILFSTCILILVILEILLTTCKQKLAKQTLMMMCVYSTIQKAAGCAARHALSCGTSLLNKANQVMIKLASKGCGEPDVSE